MITHHINIESKLKAIEVIRCFVHMFHDIIITEKKDNKKYFVSNMGIRFPYLLMDFFFCSEFHSETKPKCD